MLNWVISLHLCHFSLEFLQRKNISNSFRIVSNLITQQAQQLSPTYLWFNETWQTFYYDNLSLPAFQIEENKKNLQYKCLNLPSMTLYSLCFQSSNRPENSATICVKRWEQIVVNSSCIRDLLHYYIGSMLFFKVNEPPSAHLSKGILTASVIPIEFFFKIEAHRQMTDRDKKPSPRWCEPDWDFVSLTLPNSKIFFVFTVLEAGVYFAISSELFFSLLESSLW